MKNKTFRVRFLVMIAILGVVSIGYFVHCGLGTVCGIGLGDITLLCPLGALLAMIAERTAIPLAIVSIVIALAICIVVGKVACSWVCPVHFLSNLKPKKTKKLSMAEKESLKTACGTCASCDNPCGKSSGMKIDSRHGVLAAALVSTTLFGFPVFCIVCPIGLTFATVFLIMRLFAFGETTWTLIVFPAIILAEVVLLPRWCSHFCPLGALLSLFSGANKTFRPTIDKTKCLTRQGHECNRCVSACPEGINLHDVAAGRTTLNDCSKCKACSDVCPTHAITFPVLKQETDTVPSEAKP